MSDFSDWVFEANQFPRQRGEPTREKLLRLGSFDHSAIERFALWINPRAANQMKHWDWELLFVDPHDGTAEHVLRASRLRVKGKSLLCIPDVVLRHKETGEILIIERKITAVPEALLPANGWPNVAAQLWCYSWVDEWVSALDVYLVAQVWTRRGIWPGLRTTPICPRWVRSDPLFDKQWASVFAIYGGEVL